jgi:Family of unknown function (DUF6527)
MIALLAAIRRFAQRLQAAAAVLHLEARGLYGAVDVGELPDALKPRRIYVVGEGGHAWFAAFLCPCGCGSVIYASLVDRSSPHWRLRRHFGGAVTLQPSVRRTKGCRSHFWLRRGRVEWCGKAVTSGFRRRHAAQG